MREWDKNWAYTVDNLSRERQLQLEEANARADILLQMVNNIVDMSGYISQLQARLVLNAQVTKGLEKRIEELESYLYTHDYEYFQQEEKKQQGIADNAQLEELGTHPPNCRCHWCEPQEGEEWKMEHA